MEYFDFEDASNVPPFDLEDYASSLACEATEQDANESYESLFFDKTNTLPASRHATAGPMKLKLINNVEIEVIPHTADVSADYPMFRAKVACDLCSRMGLDCFLATRGAMVTGCTCCISLYRECSFVHPKIPKGFVSTFPGITEDQQVCEGSITERRRAMRSMEEGRGRKTGARFPREAVRILKQWLADHSDHPYPTEREKDELKQLTGLKRSQIANWLANARRRGKARPDNSDPSSPMLGAIDIPPNSDRNDNAHLNPLDRWKASPPENEPASMTAIARAVTATPLPLRNNSVSSLHGSRASSKKSSSENDSSFSMFRAPSVSSFETRESSNSDLTFASSRSTKSRGSFASSQDRRRRRRAPMTQRAAAQQAKSRNARIFQCTFCTDTFPAKYDWQRHEKSLHLALERWTCCPDGGIMNDKLTGIPVCVFCKEANPTADHLESHNFTTCQEKTLQERTFYRKDHLSQHLKLMHNTKVQPHMEQWKTTNNEIKSACGFCPSKFTTWQQRADHLAAHFRNGADMSGWSNGWGFEPFVERLVENAIPPYLIGYERNTMEPYVARREPSKDTSSSDTGMTIGTSADSGDVDQMTKDSNCWGRLEQELIKFVGRYKGAGKIPSDKEIQDQARMIIYEDTDPWNWTSADNQQWLETFKYQQGIGPYTEAMVTPLLAEVPIMPPYVVKGGLKAKVLADNCASARTKGSSASVSNNHSRSNSQSLSNSLPNSTMAPTPTFEQNMDFDFDSIDFSNLDLGMMDDVNFDMDMSGTAVAQVNGGLNVSHSTSFQPSLPADPIFGTFASDQGTAFLNTGVQQQQQQPQTSALMSEQDFNQLSGYMAGFK
ncbi:hypothetical protein B0A52_06005 [Exophiala mesophila]|uniref:Homeobox and C2H2 transcription factor n=1 Tax=Exophiala mesophila TaxID=212818 RepID=A0A438N545_EXOME|nr:hypothetical protein B0A52_06005 [Exophiala mesophila]